jgi:hypothetical protein
MTDKPGCSLWILVAVPDVRFIEHTIPHLVRMCDFPFYEKVLAVDSTPVFGEKTLRPHVGTLRELRSICETLVENGTMDRIEELSLTDGYRQSAYGHYLGDPRIKATHNYKCAPFLGYFYCIDRSRTEFTLHFNSDMLLYQEKGRNWIKKGMEILERSREILYARPYSGPYENDGQTAAADRTARDGYVTDRNFSSRCFLVKKSRFREMKGMRVMWAPAKKQGRQMKKVPGPLRDMLFDMTGRGRLDSWEKIIEKEMKERGLFRAHVTSPRAWTLHPCDHGEDFIDILPEMIEKVENGEYPPEQLDKYDVDLDAWLKFLEKQ